MKPKFSTKFGKYYIGDSVKQLSSKFGDNLQGKVQLILTSPPFPLNQKKKYGNLKGKAYLEWFTKLAGTFSRLLTPDGSIVIELGNSWEPKRPIQSTLHLESLLGFLNNPDADLRLCQQFICYNPARLPSPAQWVTVNRIRTIDSYTNIWWMAKTDFPKADNRKVLRPYSKSMNSLLRRNKYNSGTRPSQHKIGNKSFLVDNSGSIVHNVIEVEQMDENRKLRIPHNIFSLANTNSNDYFLNACRVKKIQLHPARMPLDLASFFIDFLTDPGDIVVDPFAGTNTTGYCAERLGRKWISIEIEPKYAEQSRLRFQDPVLKQNLN